MVMSFFNCSFFKGFPGGAVVKYPPANAGDARDMGLIPGTGRSLGVGNGNPLQYSCLGNLPGQRSLAGYCPWDLQARILAWVSTSSSKGFS